MIRTQIQLSEEQARRLQAMARREGVSMAELVRRCIDATLTAQETDLARRYEAARRLIGRFADRSGARDLADRHDAYLDEAFE